jgi:ABC-2 type transport system permease protein
MATNDLFSTSGSPTPAPDSTPPPTSMPTPKAAAVAEAGAATRNATFVVQAGSPLRTLFTLFVKMQLTRARVIGLSLAGLVGVLVALALHNASRLDPNVGPDLVSLFGLELFVPVTALLLSTATLGDMNDDGTLVYLWMRPVARWRIVATSVGSSFLAALPLTLIPLLLAAVITGNSADLVIGTLVSVPLSLIAYSCFFGALGLRSRRSVIWGLLYIFIIEGFVARGGDGLAHLAIRCYSESVLSSITQIPLDQGVIEPPTSWIVPLAVAAVSLVYAVRRLRVQDVP